MNIPGFAGLVFSVWFLALFGGLSWGVGCAVLWVARLGLGLGLRWVVVVLIGVFRPILVLKPVGCGFALYGLCACV